MSDDLYRSGELDTDQPLVRIKRGRGDSRYNPASNPNRGRKRIRWGKHQLCHSKQIKLMQNRSPETASQPGHFAGWHIPRCSTSDTILSLPEDLPAARAPEGCYKNPRQIENPDTKQKYGVECKEFLQWPGYNTSLWWRHQTFIFRHSNKNLKLRPRDLDRDPGRGQFLGIHKTISTVSPWQREPA